MIADEQNDREIAESREPKSTCSSSGNPRSSASSSIWNLIRMRDAILN